MRVRHDDRIAQGEGRADEILVENGRVKIHRTSHARIGANGAEREETAQPDDERQDKQLPPTAQIDCTMSPLKDTHYNPQCANPHIGT